MFKIKLKTFTALAAISLMGMTTQAFAACNEASLSYAIGNALPPTGSPGFQAALDYYKTQAGAGQVRGIPASGMATRDYKSDALWVFLDAANKITKFGCGH